MDNTEIINFLKDNPGATAQEIGVTPVEMSRLAAKGIVEKVGTRSTGTRGRPPVEWALPGTDMADHSEVTVKAPLLPPIAPEIRKAMDPEHKRAMDYIERVFRGEFPVEQYPDGGYWPEPADFKILRDRYDEIVRFTARRVHAPAIVFTDDQEDKNDE